MATSSITATNGTFNAESGLMNFSVAVDNSRKAGGDLLIAAYTSSGELIGWQIVNRDRNLRNRTYSGGFNFSASGINPVNSSGITLRVWQGTAGSSYGNGNNNTPSITYGSGDLPAGTGTGFRINTNRSPRNGNDGISLISAPPTGGTTAAFSGVVVNTLTTPAGLSLTLASDTGASAADGITSDGLINVSGLNGSSTWEYSLNGGETWQNGTGSTFTAAAGSYAAGQILVRQASEQASLSGALTVDSAAPTVSSIHYGNTDGVLSAGETITLVVSLDEAVMVNGTPTIALNTGGVATYSAGSGTNTLVFTYTAAAGQNTADLATAVTNALSGSITDLAGNAVNPRGFNNVNPTGVVQVDTISINAGSLSLRNYRDRGTSNNDQISTDNRFNIRISGQQAGTSVAYEVSLNGGTWTSTNTGQRNLADGTYQYRARVTNGQGGIGYTPVITVVVDRNAVTPGLLLSNDNGSSAVDGISNDGTVSVTGLEQGASWQYSLNGGSTWQVGTGESFTLIDGSYASGSLRVRQTDLAGNTSAIGILNTAITIDTTAPVVSGISYGSNDGTLAVGEAITLIVNFSEAVVVSGTPSIALNSGGNAVYTSGSGSSSLVFTYTPASGNSSTDLATAISNALSGSITDVAGNAVVSSGFDNVNPDGTVVVGGGSSTFDVTLTGDTVSFGGSASGTITVTIDAASNAEFRRAGVLSDHNGLRHRHTDPGE